jgi:hypothetical protein
MIIAGFTGTRHGWTVNQEATVRKVLQRTRPSLVVHGGCIGSDKQFDTLCAELGIPRRVRYASNVPPRLRAPFDRTDPDIEFTEPAPAPGRNLDIIDDSTFMIGCPATDIVPVNLRGQGTWHAIVHTRQLLHPLVLVVPTGVYMEERLPQLIKDLLHRPSPARPKLLVPDRSRLIERPRLRLL